MADESKTIGGVDYQLLQQIKTVQQYRDEISVLPDKHRVLMKTLGPLYTSYMKFNMGMKSVKDAFGQGAKASDKMATVMEKGGGAVAAAAGATAAAVGGLSKVFSPFTKVLSLTKGLFVGLVGSIMPFVGLAFGVMAAVMLLVAIFDKGGGSLRAWLTDLPLVGAAFEGVQGAVNLVKNALGAIDWDSIKEKAGMIGGALSDAFGPVLGSAMEQAKGRMTTIVGQLGSTWNNIKSNLTLGDVEIDWEGFFGAGAEALQGLVDLYFALHTMVFDSIFEIVNYFAEEGFFQRIIDAAMGIWEALEGAFDDIFGALGETGATFGSILGFIKNIWDGFIGFLFESGIFEFLIELVEFSWEWVATVIFISGKIIGIIVRFIAWVYPYVKPYAMMIINYLKIVVVVILAVVRTVRQVLRAVMALIRGDVDAAKKIFASIADIWIKTFDNIKKYFKSFVNSLIDFVSPLFDMINAGIKTFNKIPGVPNLPKINYNSWKLEKGGVMTGPKSGYPVELHGTEAVVPLPDGRSIPVTIDGGIGGGGETTVNINVSGANGDPRKIARMVGDEVGRLFKTRSRGSGFSRGV